MMEIHYKGTDVTQNPTDKTETTAELSNEIKTESVKSEVETKIISAKEDACHGLTVISAFSGRGSIQMRSDKGKALITLLENAFTPGHIRSDGIFRSPINIIADMLRDIGLQGQYLIVTLISILTMVSAKLGFPFPFMIVDEVNDADALLSIAEYYAPRGIALKAGELDDKALFRSADELPGRVIINSKFSGLKKSLPYLETLIDTGNTALQTSLASFNGKKNEQIEINGSVSLITIADDFEKSDIKCLSLIKMVLNPDNKTCLIDKAVFKDAAHLIKTQAFAKAFSRMMPGKVNITFAKELEEYAIHHRISPGVFVPLINMMSILTIINQTEPPTPEEVLESYLNSVVTLKDKIFTATKVEYYMAYKMLGGFIKNGSNDLTDRQLRIFEAIKTHNLSYLSGSTMTTMSDERDVLTTLPSNERAWINEIELRLAINNDGGSSVKDGVLRIDLKKLQSLGLIYCGKLTDKKNQHGFYIQVLNADNSIPLPDPSTILDPVYKGKAVKVINPITGEVEEIQSYKDLAEIENKAKAA